jgi:hypothetical protein
MQLRFTMTIEGRAGKLYDFLFRRRFSTQDIKQNPPRIREDVLD